jgi:polynucleotide 5'-kinase involved in rRNA processing
MPHCPNPNCNQKYSAKKGTNFCKKCGTKLDVTNDNTNQETQIPTSTETQTQNQSQTIKTRTPSHSGTLSVVMFGAGGVGKSSIILRFISGTFVEEVTTMILLELSLLFCFDEVDKKEERL